MARKARNYKAEYRDYHGQPEQRRNRSMRNQARRKVGLRRGDRREVDHKRGLARGGSNRRSNLRVVSRSTNRHKA